MATCKNCKKEFVPKVFTEYCDVNCLLDAEEGPRLIDVDRIVRKVATYQSHAEDLINSYQESIAAEKEAAADFCKGWDSQNFKDVAEAINRTEKEIRFQKGRFSVLAEILRDLTTTKEDN